MIRLLPMRYDVSDAVREIADPSVWNRYRDRLDRYGSPHSCVSDIWVRYNPIRNMDSDPQAFFHGPHESEWYPVADECPALKGLAEQIYQDVGGTKLGGVLVTKIPPGGKVLPHIDTGWHAGNYQKYAIQLQGNQDQAFCFEDMELRPETGESYTFRNDVLHWVNNDSDVDRMTLIVCLRADHDAV